MSGQSAKRYGLDVKGDLELEVRLRRMEAAIDRAGIGNNDATNLSRGKGAVPQVTGLRLGGTIPGGLTVLWTAVSISDLLRYEVQFATNLAFNAGFQKFTAATPTWSFTTAASDETTYFARVRAVNSNGLTGEWSARLNTSTGQATSADIADGSVTAEKIDEDDPIVFSGLSDESIGSQLAHRGQIDGLILSNNGAATIDISAGLCRDSTDVLSMSLPASDSIVLSGASIDTWYHVFLLASADGATLNGGFDTDVDAANLTVSSGLPMYRRLGAVLTDGSGDIELFTQHGDEFFWPAMGFPDSDFNPGSSQHTLTASHVPLGIKVKANVTLTWSTPTGNGINYCAYGIGGAILQTPDATNTDVLSEGNGRYASVSPIVLTTVAQEIETRCSNSAASKLRMRTHGWIDPRGKDA